MFDLICVSLLLAITTAGSIKLFQYYQKFNQAVGIYSRQSDQNSNSINSKNVILIVSIAQFFVSSTAFLLFDAKSILDYGISVSALLVEISVTVYMLILIYQMEKTLKFIENCEQFLEKSK